MPITDTVTVAGREWAQPADFVNLSWDQINTVCPAGICAVGSELNGYSLTGWVWADQVAVGGLFNSYLEKVGVPQVDWSGSYYPLSADSAWAPAFFDDFNPTVLSSGNLNHGLTSDPTITAYYFGVPVEFAWYASMYDASDPASRDYVRPDGGTTASIFTSRGIGAWFYREEQAAPVPITSTLFLLALGLFSLRVSSGRRPLHQSKN